jgi:ABC-type glycerol-3-phosphate transport system substrate-binding protein
LTNGYSKRLTLTAGSIVAITSSLVALAVPTMVQAAPSSSTVTTITFWVSHSGALETAVTNEVNQFNKSHPNIHVQQINEDITTKGVASFYAHKAPNVADIDTESAQPFIDAGALMDLKAFINSKSGLTAKQIKQDYYPAIWHRMQTQGGKNQYFMPIENQPEMAIYYNADLFKKAHITAAPKTWAQVEADGAKISALGGNYHGIEWTPLIRQYWAMVMDFGGKVFTNNQETRFNLNNAGASKALQFLKTMVDNKDMVLTQGYDYQLDFGTGHVGMLIDSSAGYTYDAGSAGGKFPVLAGSAPVGPSGRAYNYEKGDSLVMFNEGTSAQQQAAWEFINYMTDPSINTYWNEQTNYVPTGPAGDKMIQKFYKKNPNFAASFSDPNSWITEPPVPNFGAVITPMESELDKALAGKESIKQALQNMTTQGNNILSGKQRM